MRRYPGVRVISKRRLREFWSVHSGTEGALSTWHQVVRHSSWGDFSELRSTFPSADQVGRLTVFNVKGNEIRLIARVDFGRQVIYIRRVLTHSEYDKNDWKKDDWI